MAGGVDDMRVADHDRDMAAPENEIAAARAFIPKRPPERGFLHIRIARAIGAGGLKRDLDQTGAVNALRRAPTPDIRGSAKALGRRHPIRLGFVLRGDLAGMDPFAARDARKTVLLI